MSLLGTLGSGQGYLKAGFLGFPKSGKTWTAMLLAIGARKHFGLTGPIAMFDTEGGSEYVAPLVKRETGLALEGARSRSFDDMLKVGKEALAAKVAVLVVDSITHPWRELCDSYLRQVNQVRENNGRPHQQRLEFQDWAYLKSRWQAWTDFYLNSPMHIIICGRAGYDWDFEERDDGSGKDLVKTGVKMKTEGEFGFEPSLLVEMERVQLREGHGKASKLKKEFVHRATVLGDRFGAIDGESAEDPGFEFFLPHVSMLTPGENPTIDASAESNLNIRDDGTGFTRERRVREILCEKIEAAMTLRWPGQTKEDKKQKIEVLSKVFGTTSWKEIETRLKAEDLRVGLDQIEAMPRTTVEE